MEAVSAKSAPGLRTVVGWGPSTPVWTRGGLSPGALALVLT